MSFGIYRASLVGTTSAWKHWCNAQLQSWSEEYFSTFRFRNVFMTEIYTLMLLHCQWYPLATWQLYRYKILHTCSKTLLICSYGYSVQSIQRWLCDFTLLYGFCSELWIIQALLYSTCFIVIHKDLSKDLYKLQGIVYRREGSIRDYRSETVLH